MIVPCYLLIVQVSLVVIGRAPINQRDIPSDPDPDYDTQFQFAHPGVFRACWVGARVVGGCVFVVGGV